MSLIRDYIDGQFRDDETEEVGIGGFTTMAKVREGVSRTRDVPVTFLEDGTHINDHIIRNPLTLSIEGSVSNVFRRPSPVLAAIREAETQVGAIAQYAPARTASQATKVSGLVADVQTQIDRVDQAIEIGQRAAESLGFTGSEGKTNIERFIDFMDAVYASEALIRIDAPFRTYENMAITSINHVRNNQTDSLDFTLEAQELRFADTIFVPVAPSPSSATNGQTDGEADKGVQEGEEVPQSFVSSFLGRIGVGG